MAEYLRENLSYLIPGSRQREARRIIQEFNRLITSTNKTYPHVVHTSAIGNDTEEGEAGSFRQIDPIDRTIWSVTYARKSEEGDCLIKLDRSSNGQEPYVDKLLLERRLKRKSDKFFVQRGRVGGSFSTNWAYAFVGARRALHAMQTGSTLPPN